MAEDRERERERRTGSGAHAAPPLVLVVEDNEDLRELYAEHLRRVGYCTAQAGNGAAALDAARELKPAIVLLDYQMPVMDGFEAARRSRANPKTRDIPLVLVTSSPTCSPPPLLFDDRVDKPCLPERLEAVVEDLLGDERSASRARPLVCSASAPSSSE